MGNRQYYRSRCVASEIPSTNDQVPNKSQWPKFKTPNNLEFRKLEFVICLEFVIWKLELPLLCSGGRGKSELLLIFSEKVKVGNADREQSQGKCHRDNTSQCFALEIPKPNIQIPNKFQIQKFKLQTTILFRILPACGGSAEGGKNWDLRFVWNLGFGAWSFHCKAVAKGEK